MNLCAIIGIARHPIHCIGNVYVLVWVSCSKNKVCLCVISKFDF